MPFSVCFLFVSSRFLSSRPTRDRLRRQLPLPRSRPGRGHRRHPLQSQPVWQNRYFHCFFSIHDRAESINVVCQSRTCFLFALSRLSVAICLRCMFITCRQFINFNAIQVIYVLSCCALICGICCFGLVCLSEILDFCGSWSSAVLQ